MSATKGSKMTKVNVKNIPLCRTKEAYTNKKAKNI
jgi:hypothetical protein